MGTTMYIDESIRREFHLIGCVVADSRKHEIRRELRSLRMKRQRSIHMRKEGHKRREVIFRGIFDLEFITFIAIAPQTISRDQRRTACIRELIKIGSTLDVGQFIFEASTQNSHDRQTLAGLAYATDYIHLPPHAEPLLWLPDIVGWGWGRDAATRALLAPKVQEIRVQA